MRMQHNECTHTTERHCLRNYELTGKVSVKLFTDPCLFLFLQHSHVWIGLLRPCSKWTMYSILHGTKCCLLMFACLSATTVRCTDYIMEFVQLQIIIICCSCQCAVLYNCNTVQTCSCSQMLELKPRPALFLLNARCSLNEVIHPYSSIHLQMHR